MEKIDLRALDPRDYRKQVMTPSQVLALFENEDACWFYQGEPCSERPHAELTSGLCSNGFIDCLRVLRYPNIAEVLGFQLARLLRDMKVRPDWVVSSAYAAITFGHEVAKAMKAIFMLAEKDPQDPQAKRMVWRRMTIPTGARVLQVEELITTSGTFQEVRRAVEEGNAEKPVVFISDVGALVHRPPKLPIEYGDRRVIALIEREIQAFKPEECPYCKIGSTRYRPKTHWRELTGK